MYEILLMAQSSLIWMYVLFALVPASLFALSMIFGGVDTDVDFDADIDYCERYLKHVSPKENCFEYKEVDD